MPSACSSTTGNARRRRGGARLLEAARQELAYLDQLAVMPSAADPALARRGARDLRDWRTPEPSRAEEEAEGKATASRAARAAKAQPGPSPLRVKAADGTEILVGRSAKQNEAVTFALAGPQDLWLHARQIPGAHVILRHGGRPPSAGDDLARRRRLAATYSQARTATTVPVDYAPVRNVRRIKGGKPGLVHYSGETTIVVRPSELAAR